MTVIPFSPRARTQAEINEILEKSNSAIARHEEFMRKMEDENFEPQPHSMYEGTTEPLYWLVLFFSKDALDEFHGGYVSKLCHSRKEAFQAMRNRLIEEYANSEDDIFREPDEIAAAAKDREFLATATLDQMRVWLKKADRTARLEMNRLQPGHEMWI